MPVPEGNLPGKFMELGSPPRGGTGQTRRTPGEPGKIKINGVSPELSIDLRRSGLLSGIEQLKKVKIDKICLKIIYLENC